MYAPFVGREAELSHMEALYAAPGAKALAICGRRRVGMTRLLREFCRGKRALLFAFKDLSLKENLWHAEVVVAEFTGAEASFGTAAAFLESLVGICAEGKTVVVMEGFPHLVGGDAGVMQAVCGFIDDISETESMLVICGSPVPMMRELLESPGNPLAGRFPDRMVLEPLSLRQCALLHPGMSDADVLRTYLTVGGMPLYHLIMSGPAYEDSVKAAFLAEQAPLRDEFMTAVGRELSPKRVYSLMLWSMSRGARTQSEVAAASDISPSLCKRYMDNLVSHGFVAKDPPAPGRKAGRFYRISDPLTLFGYEVVRRIDVCGGEDPDGLYVRCAPKIGTCMGKAFGDAVAEYIGITYRPGRMGRWTGRADGTVEDFGVVAEIDIGGGRDLTLLCGCVFRRTGADMEDMVLLEQRAEAAGFRMNRRFAMASAGGFTRELEEYAEDNGVMLIGLDEIMGRTGPEPLVRTL
ncbi:MAG: hypothetical protein Q4Q62_02610 [Thermoplasmata archaeon]|nr:hypothetical protein [Thermoplasmata archaeon]